MKRLFNSVWVVGLLAVASSSCGKKNENTASIGQLVKIYAKRGGAAAVAERQITNAVSTARQELIRLLDDRKTSKVDASAIINLLLIDFPCNESSRAVDRFRSRVSDPTEQDIIQHIQRMTAQPNVAP